MIGYNFGLGFMPGPFCFGASRMVVLSLLDAQCQMQPAPSRVFSPRPPLAQLDRATAF